MVASKVTHFLPLLPTEKTAERPEGRSFVLAEALAEEGNTGLRAGVKKYMLIKFHG